MTKQFLPLEEAVKIAVYHFGADKKVAEQEFEQKCFISDDYTSGFEDGLKAAVKAIEFFGGMYRKKQMEETFFPEA